MITESFLKKLISHPIAGYLTINVDP